MDKPPRAKPLSVEDRRAMLVDAVTPLLVAHGQAVTTKQIAECAGIAEGTIFRAFESKEELIQAAITKQLDPEPFRRQLLEIDPTVPLEERVHTIVALMRVRFTRVFALMTALGSMEHRKPHTSPHELTEIMGEVLAPDLERLHFPPARTAQLMRMVALAASVPQLRAGDPFTDDEITEFILHGIVGRPPAPMPATT